MRGIVAVATLVAVGLLALVLFRGAPAGPAGSAKAPAARAEAPAGAPPAGVDPRSAASLAEVEAQAAARNRLEARETDTFVDDGWTMVSAPPPDQRLLAYDPALLDGRGAELRAQLASTVARRADVPNLAAIARAARTDEMREAAVDALGRAGGPEAQRALHDLVVEGRLDEASRRQAVALLRPDHLDDPWAATLAALLDAPGLSAADREQLAFTLSLVGLRDGMSLPPEVLANLSPAARQLLASTTALALAGPTGGPHAHAHD